MKKLSENFNNTNFLEITFCLLPVSFVLGNLVLNFHILFFIVASSIFIGFKKFSIKIKKVYWLIGVFFLYFLTVTFLQYQSVLQDFLSNVHPKHFDLEKTNLHPKDNPVIKSLLYLRFIFFIILADILFEKKIIKLERFFFFITIITLSLAFDIIIQYFVGYDLFGFKSSEMGNTGFFGDEKIAGSFLQKFSFIGFFYIYLFFKNFKFKSLYLIIVYLIYSMSILFAGNKVPLLLFILGTVIGIILVKNLRAILLSGLISFSILFLAVINIDESYKNYVGFINEIFYVKSIEKKKEETSKSDVKINKSGELFYLEGSGHGRIFKASLETWKRSPIFGSGLKSFRLTCWRIMNERGDIKFGCSNHPHNYYLQILTEGGLVGLGLLIVFLGLLLKKSYTFLKNNYRTQTVNYLFFTAIFIEFFIEIWPLKSTGGFFSTWTSSSFWLLIPILIYSMSAKTKY